MNFVALNASLRKKGNSELLAKLSTKEALNTGADHAELINLREFKIEPCNGCMRCVFHKERCNMDDDFYSLMEKISTADAFLLTSPVYVTTIPANLKMLMDRAFLFPDYYKKLYGHPAMSVASASPIDWEAFQLPLMNMLLLGLGFLIKDSFIIHGAGPGEVLLQEKKIQRFLEGIKKICQLTPNRRTIRYSDHISNHCPVCFSTLLERYGKGLYRCPVCLTMVEETDEGLVYKGDSMNKHRWTPDKMKGHFEGWITGTKNRFKDMLRNIMKKKETLDCRTDVILHLVNGRRFFLIPPLA